jgi:hypothetical protein
MHGCIYVPAGPLHKGTPTLGKTAITGHQGTLLIKHYQTVSPQWVSLCIHYVYV